MNFSFDQELSELARINTAMGLNLLVRKPVVGEYCQAANAVAIKNEQGCKGKIRVKGQGMGEGDIYNESYDRECQFADVCQRRRLI